MGGGPRGPDRVVSKQLRAGGQRQRWVWPILLTIFLCFSVVCVCLWRCSAKAAAGWDLRALKREQEQGF